MVELTCRACRSFLQFRKIFPNDGERSIQSRAVSTLNVCKNAFGRVEKCAFLTVSGLENLSFRQRHFVRTGKLQNSRSQSPGKIFWNCKKLRQALCVNFISNVKIVYTRHFFYSKDGIILGVRTLATRRSDL